MMNLLSKSTIHVGKYTSPVDTMGNMSQFQLATSIDRCRIVSANEGFCEMNSHQSATVLAEFDGLKV